MVVVLLGRNSEIGKLQRAFSAGSSCGSTNGVTADSFPRGRRSHPRSTGLRRSEDRRSEIKLLLSLSLSRPLSPSLCHFPWIFLRERGPLLPPEAGSPAPRRRTSTRLLLSTEMTAKRVVVVGGCRRTRISPSSHLSSSASPRASVPTPTTRTRTGMTKID